MAFVRTNVLGTQGLLDACRNAWRSADGQWRSGVRFHHVSTDEVFGALGPADAPFTEASPYAPNSPYSASKAGSDLLVRAAMHTHGLPASLSWCSNNYGPWQVAEKLIPLMITNAAEGKKLPVYGEGKQIREWLHVDDHAAGLWAALVGGRPGESYLFGSGEERSNREMVELIADVVDEHLGRTPKTARALIHYVPDRKGHDFRYAIDPSKAQRELGWRPERVLREELRATVAWYLANVAWRRAVATAEHLRFQAAYYGKGSE